MESNSTAKGKEPSGSKKEIIKEESAKNIFTVKDFLSTSVGEKHAPRKKGSR